MTYTFPIPRGTLKALSRFMMKPADERSHMQCVYFDTALGRMVATDGATLAVAKYDFPASMPSCLIPRDAVMGALKMSTARAETLPCSLEFADDGATGMLGGVQVIAELSGYPQWQRVIPHTVTGEYANYNIAYLERARAAFADHAGREVYPSVVHNGEAPGIVACDSYPDILVIIMPRRADRGVTPVAADELIRQYSCLQERES